MRIKLVFFDTRISEAPNFKFSQNFKKNNRKKVRKSFRNQGFTKHLPAVKYANPYIVKINNVSKSLGSEVPIPIGYASICLRVIFVDLRVVPSRARSNNGLFIIKFFIASVYLLDFCCKAQ